MLLVAHSPGHWQPSSPRAVRGPLRWPAYGRAEGTCWLPSHRGPRSEFTSTICRRWCFRPRPPCERARRWAGRCRPAAKRDILRCSHWRQLRCHRVAEHGPLPSPPGSDMRKPGGGRAAADELGASVPAAVCVSASLLQGGCCSNYSQPRGEFELPRRLRLWRCPGSPRGRQRVELAAVH